MLKNISNKMFNGLYFHFQNYFLWKCNPKHIFLLYKKNLSNRHLHIGHPIESILSFSKNFKNKNISKNISIPNYPYLRYPTDVFSIEEYQSIITEKITLHKNKEYSSISICYLFEFMTGNFREKFSKVFDLISPIINKKGIIFGTIIIGKDINNKPRITKRIISYNNKNILFNKNDSLSDLINVLSNKFKKFNIQAYGCLVLFCAKEIK